MKRGRKYWKWLARIGITKIISAPSDTIIAHYAGGLISRKIDDFHRLSHWDSREQSEVYHHPALICRANEVFSCLLAPARLPILALLGPLRSTKLWCRPWHRFICRLFVVSGFEGPGLFSWNASCSHISYSSGLDSRWPCADGSLLTGWASYRYVCWDFCFGGASYGNCARSLVL